MVKELSDQQLTAITHMVAGCTQREAAERAGVDEATVSRWKHNDETFRAAYEQRRRAVWKAHGRKLRALAGEALDVLSDAMQSDDESTRLQAAKFILGAIDLADLQAAEPTRSPLDDIMAGVDW